MGQKIATTYNSWTPTATADATNLVNATYQGLQGGVSTQRTTIREVFLGGVATASAPSLMVLARDSQVGATPTATTGHKIAVIDGSAVLIANPPVQFDKTVTTLPQRSSTLGLLSLGFNAFGGIIRWVAAPGEEITMIGAAASFGESSLSAFTGGTPGLLNSHLLLETE